MLYTRTEEGDPPINLELAKSFLKVDFEKDDVVISSMIAGIIEYAEGYTSRELRANTWTVLFDEFAARMCLRRSPVATVTEVAHLVSAAFVAVASSVYYLKVGQHWSEVLLANNQEWPTTTDEGVEHAVKITFTTTPYAKTAKSNQALLKHLAFWYENRGDSDVNDAAVKSGASVIYDQFRIVRI